MKKVYTAFKTIRVFIIFCGIPLIIIELGYPGLLDFSTVFGDTYILGVQTQYLVQIVVVISELSERIMKLKEARFYLFSPRLVPILRRIWF